MEEETDDKKKCKRCSILSEIRGAQIKTTMRTSNGEKCGACGNGNSKPLWKTVGCHLNLNVVLPMAQQVYSKIHTL